MFARDVSEAELSAGMAHYAAEGWALFRGVASADFLAVLRQRTEEIVAGTIVYPGLFFQADTPTGRYEDLGYGDGYEGPDRPYRKIEKLELDPLFRAWIENPFFARIARRVYPGDISIYRAVLFSKTARTGSETPYHQDGGRLWGLDREPALQIWTALDRASPEAGCLEICPGTHHLGLASPLGGVVPAQQVLSAHAEARAVTIPVEAGDVVLIHNFLWHRSGPNRSDAPRRGFTVCYLDAATRCTRKRKAPRQFVPVFRLSLPPASASSDPPEVVPER